MNQESTLIILLVACLTCLHITAVAQEVDSATHCRHLRDADATPHCQLKGLLSIGMHSTPSNPNISPYLALSLGVDIHNRAYLGAGVGAITCFVPKQWSSSGWHLGATLPHFYLQSDIYLTPQYRWRPYASLSAGFSFAKGLMRIMNARIGAGVEYKGLAIQVGYTPMIIKYTSNVPQPDKPLQHGLYLDVGYRFCPSKYNKAAVSSQYSVASSGIQSPAKSAHFQGVAYVGVGVYHYVMPSTTLSLGVAKDRNYFFGGGVGMLIYMSTYHDTDPMNKSLYAIPLPMLYLQGDVYLTRRWKCAPYLTVEAGAVVPFALYAKAGLGVDYRSFVWTLTYSPFFPPQDPSLICHGITFNFGYRFNTAKHNRQHRVKGVEKD